MITVEKDSTSKHFIDVQYVNCTVNACDYSHWLDAVNFHGSQCPNCGGVCEYTKTYEVDTKNKKARVIHRSNNPTGTPYDD